MEKEILPACDLCHARKVKCDRQEKCSNCSDAGAECRRLRPHRLSKPKHSSTVSTLEERILNLEKVASQSRSENQSPNRAHQADGDTSAKKRKIDHATSLESTPCSGAESITGPEDSIHHARNAKSIIQNLLSGSENIGRERQTILRTAMSHVDKMAKGVDSDLDKDLPSQTTGIDDLEIAPPDAPPPELLYMLLQEPMAVVTPGSRLQWPDHISDNTLEKVVAYLLESEPGGQIYHQYCICVYVKGLTRSYNMSKVCPNQSIRKHLWRSMMTYQAGAIAALRQLDILSTPSLSLVQSLISAAILMQYLGKMNQAWVLNSYAARLVVSLNYYDIISTRQVDEEICSAFIWCYFLDKTLSALLIRPPSLPKTQIAPTDLLRKDTALVYSPLIRILLDLSTVQGELLDISLGKHEGSHQVLATCQALQDRMGGISAYLESTRASLPDIVVCDWLAVDFSFYAILVDVLRTRLRYAPSPLTHRECLSYARSSLKIFQCLQEQFRDIPSFSPYPAFLSWTVFLYPLTPFFVLFCNVIGALDKSDYDLIREFTQGLSRFTLCPYMAKVLSLLTSLQLLCDPLFQNREQTNPATRSRRWIPEVTTEPQASTFTETTLAAETSPPSESAGLFVPGQIPAEISPSSDGLMWQLFNSQLSLGLFEPDYLSFGMEG